MCGLLGLCKALGDFKYSRLPLENVRKNERSAVQQSSYDTNTKESFMGKKIWTSKRQDLNKSLTSHRAIARC